MVCTDEKCQISVWPWHGRKVCCTWRHLFLLMERRNLCILRWYYSPGVQKIMKKSVLGQEPFFPRCFLVLTQKNVDWDFMPVGRLCIAHRHCLPLRKEGTINYANTSSLFSLNVSAINSHSSPMDRLALPERFFLLQSDEHRTTTRSKIKMAGNCARKKSKKFFHWKTSPR